MDEIVGGEPSALDPKVVGIRCESYPEDCHFAMQAGVFRSTPTTDAFLPSMEASETCPTCGGNLEEWDPKFAGTAPGRPFDWGE